MIHAPSNYVVKSGSGGKYEEAFVDRRHEDAVDHEPGNS